MKRLQGSPASSACDSKEKKSTNSKTTKKWLQLESIPAHIYKWHIQLHYNSSETNLTLSSKPKEIYPIHLHDTYQNANNV